MTGRLALAATLLVAPGAAAQQPATYDPGRLPALAGRVAQYSLTPRGDVDGLILADGTEVHTPPHLGARIVGAVSPGDAVTVRGLRARAVPMIQAASITNDATGATVTDAGPATPPGPRAAPHALDAAGRIKARLHGPRGELNGALLDDGTIVRLPPPEAQRLAAALAVGATLTVRGLGVDGPLGRAIEAHAVRIATP